jgi:Rieske Fe-S protein
LTWIDRLVNLRSAKRERAWPVVRTIAPAGAPTISISALGGAIVSDCGHKRRTVLKGALGLGLTLPLLEARAAVEDDPKKARPQEGDQFVFFSGDRKGEIIKRDDLPEGGPQTLAYPMDPATETVRDGSRLNQVLLIRLAPDQLTKDTSANAVEGVVAYSAACTHEACPVSMWKEGTLYCACHGSQYDPKDAAKVVGGPAPRRLAMLPLRIEGGVLVAAGPFTGRVGAAKR